MSAAPDRHDCSRAGAVSRAQAEEIARTLKAVADPTRIQILAIVAGAPSGETTVGELADALGLRQPTITHHLRILIDDGLLTREPRGRQVWVSISPERWRDVRDVLR